MPDIADKAAVDTVTLPAVLDLPAASPLAQAFLDRRGYAATVDASGVQRLGGQCLQVLLAAQNAWAADGTAFRIVTPSADFAAALGSLGAASLLQCCDPA